MGNKNNNKKIMEIFESINEKYKIGDIEDSQLDPTGDLCIEIRINSFLFNFLMTKKKYDSINKDINDGNEKDAYDKILIFIIGCLDDIDIEYMFDRFYESHNTKQSPFELVDSLRALKHKTDNIVNNIKLKNK